MKLQAYLDDTETTHAEFAKALGVRRATISDWCRGKAIPRSDLMRLVEEKTEGRVPMAAWFDSEAAA